MVHSYLFIDLIIIIVAAFFGAIAVRLLRLPTILGYLGVGILVGPHGLGLVREVESVETLAEFGVILLLFAVGVELSLSDLRKVGNRTVAAGALQIGAMMAVGFGVGRLLGWSGGQTVVLGFVLALSSTMVVLKTLSDRGELQMVHGRILTGFMLLQDLAFVPMIAVIPALSGDGGLDLAGLGIGLGQAFAVLGLILLLGGRVVPWLLTRVANIGSRETFVLAVVTIAFAAAAATNAVGLSAALGAFAAGLVISESDWIGHQALQQIMPLRDIFAALFFASLGAATDPAFVLDNLPIVLLLAAVAIVVKGVVTVGAVKAAGYLPNTALRTGFGNTQIGEFGFILAATAATAGAVGADFLPLVAAATVITMAATPGFFVLGARLTMALAGRDRRLRPYLPGASGAERASERLPRYHDHVLLAGYGRVGSLVAETLAERAIPLIAIDEDPAAVRRAVEAGHHALLGDAANDSVLRAAGIDRARVLIIAAPDPVATVVTAQHAVRLHPRLPVIARVGWGEAADRMRKIGVQDHVWPEMEAGVEMISRALRHYDDHSVETEAGRREARERLATQDTEEGG
ncbi:MAG: cation:proton antiporter [Chloroflexota bacterium]|nr:cation:proton antiporter [Chloroflexota bacterium]